jgi:hypothetical protein
VYEGDTILAIPDSPFKRVKYYNLSNHARKLAEMERVVSIIIVDGGRRTLEIKDRDSFEHACREQALAVGPLVKLNQKGFACMLFEGPHGTPGMEHMELNIKDETTVCPASKAFMAFMEQCKNFVE